MCGWFSAHYLCQEGISVRGHSPTYRENLWLLVPFQRVPGEKCSSKEMRAEYSAVWSVAFSKMNINNFGFND